MRTTRGFNELCGSVDGRREGRISKVEREGAGWIGDWASQAARRGEWVGEQWVSREPHTRTVLF